MIKLKTPVKGSTTNISILAQFIVYGNKGNSGYSDSNSTVQPRFEEPRFNSQCNNKIVWKIKGS